MPSPSRARARRLALAAAFAPGALAGTQLAGLLFFLNPQLPFQPVPVLRCAGVYALLLGAAGAALLGPLAWRRPERALRLLPWCLAGVLAAAAIAAWIHAHRYTFFLPPGINQRLIKAAVSLTLAAAVAFYTAWLHAVGRRPYGPRTRVLLWLVALASVYAVMERREAFKPAVGRGRPTSFAVAQRPHLLVVGVETLTLDAVLPLAEQGWLPFFSRLIEEGSWSRLRTLRPVRRLPLWTSLVSGKHPFKHGVVGARLYPAGHVAPGAELRLVPGGIGFASWGVWGEPRPVTAADRRVLALWGILERLGLETAVVGWPLTTPPPSASVALGEGFFAGADAAAATSGELAERALLFRPRAEELDPDALVGFGPEPPPAVVEALTADLWRQAVAGSIVDASAPEALFLHLPGLREVSVRYFGGYAEAQFEGTRDDRAERAREVVAAYYRHLDALVSALWRRLPTPRLLAVVSAHGVAPRGDLDALSQALRGRAGTGASFAGAPDGALFLLGDGIAAGAMPGPPDLVDVVPTLLYGLGYPIARDFDGAVTTTAFETAFLAGRPLVFVPSYETFAPPD